ncbi:rubrerythrin family protein [Anaeromicropila herbilytica]|uniref:Rubrerythrin n=1 Tax=Anaeromicropila herbilytica TaxID=2785025 RepID=A0A7R7EN85_9FIRM|nr:rubrerythrin family protein [Anaeromicropila herbilytica]BCN31944.1 rubrerythrin [Anaeromicropila herbilytica]
MELKDSKTYQNLMKAFEMETRNNTSYQIYGIKAREDGYEQMGDIYDQTARNEREHAKLWYKLMHDGELPSTLDNLIKSAEFESNAWLIAYPEYAKVAREEGFSDIAELFDGVATIEKHHDYRFNSLIQNIRNERVFCKNKKALWLCINCGNIVWADCAPGVCAVCGFPQGFYELNCENF